MDKKRLIQSLWEARGIGSELPDDEELAVMDEYAKIMMDATQPETQSGEAVVSSFLEIIKRIEHDEILCHCPLCKPESYNKRFIWSISETIKLIKKNC